MVTHLGISLNSGNYIFIREDMSYDWGILRNFKAYTHYTKACNTSETIEEWIANTPKYRIHYIGSFTDFTTFQQEHPEHFL